jgi:putative PEP-CTERM system TPR-repeat lipoprotein
MNRLLSAVAAALAFIVWLAGCSNDTPETRLASAKHYLAQNDSKSAYIELKNALQQQPDLGEARFLLGKVMFDGGELAPAAIELRKANELHYAPEAVVPLLAGALLRQGQGKALIQEFGTTTLATPQARAELQTALATAYALEDHQADKADAALAAAFQAVPDYVPALIVSARRQVGQGDPKAAFATLDRALAKAPNDPDALVLQGDMLWGLQGNADGAVAAYRRATEARGDDLAAYAGALTVQLARSDLTAARLQLDALRKVRPDHPLTRFFAARLAFQEGDLTTANNIAHQLLKVLPDDPQTLQLAGAIALRTGSMLQGQQLLSKALEIAPQSAPARRMLTQILLTSGQPQTALSTALPLLDARNPPDATSLKIVGLAYLQNGNPAKAEELFGQAHALDPADSASRTALAVTRLVGGRADDAALGELEAVAVADQGIGADLALITGHLQRHDAVSALKAIDQLQAKQPGKPLAPNLRGRLLVARGDVAGARRAFEQALTADPLYLPAIESLAELDLQDANAAAAEQRYDGILKLRPNDAAALMALARTRIGGGKSGDDVVGLIDRAVRAEPAAPAPRVGLVDYYLGVHDAKRAQEAAEAATAALPGNPDILEAQGRALLAAGDVNRAVSSYSSLVALRPRSAQALVSLAGAQMAAKNPDGALQSLKQALAVAPDYAPALKMTIALDQLAGRHSDALAVAHGVQRHAPDAAAGYLYEGDIETLEKHWAPAAAAYRVALTKKDNGGAVQRLHMVLTADGKRAQADALAATWLAKQPRDVGLLFYLGDLALAERNYGAARERFARVLEVEPSNPEAHNNLAWTLGQLGQGGAIDHARKANQLRPHQPAFLDTLAGLLAAQNKLEDAIALEREAVQLAPEVRSRRLALARYYAKAGQKPAARQELETILNAGEATLEYKEAQGLMKAL